jgi:undecaprenyl-diphosphatase
VTYWLVLQPGAADAQADLVVRLNDPPPPLSAVMAASNALLRPVALTVVALGLCTWVLLTAPGRPRGEVVRAALLSVVLSELVSQVLKRLADQPRPTAVVPGLDVHGYPKDPFGNAYPSAHTAVTVGLVTAMWPWLSRPQRVVGATLALLVALNRLYIGAHWPVDVVGGAAVGLLSGAVCWLVAARWPLARGERRADVDPGRP